MENNKSKRNKLTLVILLIMGIISITIGVTYSFFNYTRTGLANKMVCFTARSHNLILL